MSDLRDRAAVDRALKGVSIVYHLGGIVGNGQSMVEVREYSDANVVGTATLLEAMLARRASLRRVVVSSSMVVYGDGAYVCVAHGVLSFAKRPGARLAQGLWEPVCPHCGAEVQPTATLEDQPLRPNSVYGINKRDQEELSLVLGRAYGLPTIALRYMNVYGSRQALSNPYTGVAAIMATRLLHGKAPTVFEDGQQRRALLHVSDAVRANLAAADAGDAALYLPFNVGPTPWLTVLELAAKLARALGRDIAPSVTGEHRDGDIRHCFADVTRARELLGFEARVTIDQGIGELAAWASGESPEDPTEAANADLRAPGVLR